jgi:hypothetical protein
MDANNGAPISLKKHQKVKPPLGLRRAAFSATKLCDNGGQVVNCRRAKLIAAAPPP